MKRFLPLRLLLLAALGLTAAAGTALARTFTVMAYNVENLDDADGLAIFDDYKAPKYTASHVLTKVRNIASVLAKVGDGHGPDVILFDEIEVDLTPAKAPLDYDAILQRYAGEKIEDMLGAKFNAEIADLPAEALLAKACADRGLTGYHIIVGDNVQDPPGKYPLAQKCVIFSRFPVKATRSLPTTSARAIVEVQVDVDGATLYLFDNHWKSGAGDPAMERVRVKNARTLRTRLDEILKTDPAADIIIGGDFNSQYNQSERYAKTMTTTGMNDVLRSQGDEAAVRTSQRDLYNLWYDLPPKQRGSDTYQGEWGTLMQIIVSRGLFDYRGIQYVDGSFTVAKFPGMNEDANGEPVRWSGEGATGSGFSDHFPVYARFRTVADDDPGKFLPLKSKPPEPAAEPVVKVGSSADTSQAIDPSTLAGGVSIRTPEYTGKLFQVDGTVAPGSRLKVVFRGETYDVWSFDASLRKRMREAFAEGAPIRFVGELGLYKEHWQFVVRDENWVKWH